MNNEPNFYTGRLVATRSIANLMGTDPVFSEFISECLKKYTQCDWGDTCKEDASQNDDSVKGEECRMLAVYNLPERCAVANEKSIWIITEWDRSATTILFPSEY